MQLERSSFEDYEREIRDIYIYCFIGWWNTRIPNFVRKFVSIEVHLYKRKNERVPTSGGRLRNFEYLPISGLNGLREISEISNQSRSELCTDVSHD